jgi:hypothetical protein
MSSTPFTADHSAGLESETQTLHWGELLVFGQVRPDGRAIVQLGPHHLLVGGTALEALHHLASSNPATTPDSTLASLAEVLPDGHATSLQQRLLSLLPAASRETFVRQAQRGRLRIPLWRPPATLAERARGRILRPIYLVGWGLVLLAAVWSVRLGPLPPLTGLSAVQWPLMWGLLALTALIHEMGHVLVAAHYGVPTRRVGLALMYLQPAGYSDVSDAWRTTRQARIAIALGGLLFDTAPLLVGYSLWRMLGTPFWGMYCIVTLAQMVFNLVPFVRLDGYWLLSNVLDEPNLRQRAFRQLSHVLTRGARPAVWSGSRGALAAGFAAASAVTTVALYASALLGVQRILLPEAHSILTSPASVLPVALSQVASLAGS